MTFWWTVGAFVLILTPIILVHEIGHFVAARLSGIRVEEFGLGFPPRAVKLFERGGTLFSLNWIPVGGFVRPAGEDDPTVPGGLASASKRARLFVLAAGAGANFIFAILIFWIAFMYGSPVFDQVAVAEVREGTPAMAAGLLTGDIITEINGVTVENYEALSEQVAASIGETLEMVINRNGEIITVQLTPRLPGEYDPNTDGPLGISLQAQSSGARERLNPIRSAAASVATAGGVVYTTLKAPVMLIRGELTPQEARPVSVVGISQIAGREARSGDLFRILFFAGIINVALGFTNLLPIPALDGGRILFVLIEAIRGRRVEPEREGMVHLVGMVILLGLMLLMIIQDIVNPIQF
jgi:regulator of sigma E protease